MIRGLDWKRRALIIGIDADTQERLLEGEPIFVELDERAKLLCIEKLLIFFGKDNESMERTVNENEIRHVDGTESDQ